MRTNIEIDEELVSTVMKRYGLRTKKEAVDLALRYTAGTPLTMALLEEAEGIGWGETWRKCAMTPRSPRSDVYIVDTSAWVEYFRKTGSRAHREVSSMVHCDEPTAGVTEPVIMEVLAGARDTGNFRRIEQVTKRMPLCRVDPVCDFTEAGALYKVMRSEGMAIRSMVDCIIAAVAWRNDATLVHADRDFDAIASRYPLRVMSLV